MQLNITAVKRKSSQSSSPCIVFKLRDGTGVGWGRGKNVVFFNNYIVPFVSICATAEDSEHYIQSSLASSIVLLGCELIYIF